MLARCCVTQRWPKDSDAKDVLYVSREGAAKSVNAKSRLQDGDKTSEARASEDMI